MLALEAELVDGGLGVAEGVVVRRAHVHAAELVLAERRRLRAVLRSSRLRG